MPAPVALIPMSAASYDLRFDPNDVDGDLVVECWISHGPRAGDPSFDPQVGDRVVVRDADEEPDDAVVIRRDGNRVWVRIELTADIIRATELASSATG